MRVLHGTMEIANQMHTMVQGLRKMNIEARSLNYYPGFLGYKSDEVVDIRSFNNNASANQALKELALRMIPQYDIFHFHFGTSLTLDYSDLPLILEQNRKVLMHHWGSDIRRYSLAVGSNPYVQVKSMDENPIKSRLERLSKYIDTCMVCDYELYRYVKDYYKNVVIFPQVIDIEEYEDSGNRVPGKKITIVHAPTDTKLKGTAHLLKAVDELKENYDFDFRLIQRMSHEEARKAYLSADVVVDQLLIGAYGLVSIENMALGKPVICWISEFMKDKYPEELPVISANPDNIKEKLRHILENADCLPELGRKSRAYAEKYHDIGKLNKQLLEIYIKL